MTPLEIEKERQKNIDIVVSWFRPELPYLPDEKEFHKIIQSTWVKNWQTETRIERSKYNKFSWPILHKENIQNLVKFINSQIDQPKILEVGAGTGWLSYWLGEYGLNIVATTDNKSWHKKHNYDNSPVAIKKYGAIAAIRRFISANVILMSWPPYRSTMPSRVLKELRRDQIIIYIGEDNGCTATPNFCDRLQYNNKIEYWDQFHAMHDSVWIISNNNPDSF